MRDDDIVLTHLEQVLHHILVILQLVATVDSETRQLSYYGLIYIYKASSLKRNKQDQRSCLPVPGTDVMRNALWLSGSPQILGVGTATILARQDTTMMVLQDIRDRSDRIEKMLRKHGLNLDEHDEEGPTAKRRRLNNHLNQSMLDNLDAATVTWVEGDGNRIFKTKGKGPNAMAMAKRWRDGMTLDKGITNCSGWTDEQLLYNFVTVSKEVARQERVGGNQEPADIDDNDDSEG